jgi:hypothetical protein
MNNVHKLTHANTIEAPLDKLVLGFIGLDPKPTWSIYTDTWKMIDGGEKDVLKLPLYKLMKKHYCSKNLKRWKKEQEILHLKSPDCVMIAYTWVEKHIELYHSIKKDGYLPELRHKPVAVHIRDDGSLFLLDGTHTASILMHLGKQKTITAEVKSRGGGWELLKKRLYGIYGKKLLYQPPDHPDMMDWSVDRPSPHRWDIIENTLGDVRGLRILDVGSCTGHFSIKLAKVGAKVTGSEPHKTRHDVSKVMAKYQGLSEDNPHFTLDSFEENLKRNTYDVALVFSVLHHYFRRNPQEAYDAFDLLSKRCSKLLLEVGVNRMSIEWDPELVLQHSQYSKYTTVYDGERPIYLYEK